MHQLVRAVYEDGQLRLLDPVHLEEGQQVSITILPDIDSVRDALGDLVAPIDLDDGDASVEHYADEIEQAFSGARPLSDLIIEERGEQL